MSLNLLIIYVKYSSMRLEDYALRILSDFSGALKSWEGFFSTKDFLTPFLSTFMASLSIILLGVLGRYISERKKKLYAVAYMLDITYRLLHSTLVILKHTVIPHIVVAGKILNGDEILLKKTFDIDDFNILTDNVLQFSGLSEEYKILLGFDDIEMVSVFEAVIYLNSNISTKNSLNTFCEKEFYSYNNFISKSKQAQAECLNKYIDFLYRIKHDNKRILHFIAYVVIPRLLKYSKSLRFIFFSKAAIKDLKVLLVKDFKDYKDFIPPQNWLEEVKNGGVQNFIKEGAEN